MAHCNFPKCSTAEFKARHTFFISFWFMPRPRASHHNLRVALAFSRVVVVREKRWSDLSWGWDVVYVPCKGPRAVFPAFKECFPDLTREANDTTTEKNGGVAPIELNKMMQVNLHANVLQHSCTLAWRII